MIRKKIEQPPFNKIYEPQNFNSDLEHENEKLSKSLRLSEEKFQKVLNNEILGIALLEEDGKFISTNQAWLDIFGYKQNEIYDYNNFDLLFEDRQYYFDYLGKLKTGEVESFRVRDEFKNRDGDEVSCSLDISPIFDDKKVLFLQTVHKTEKVISDSLFIKNQFRFLNSIINSIPNPVYYVNTHGIFLGCNRAFGELTGNGMENLFGRSIFDLAPMEVAQKERESDLQLINSQHSVCYEAKFPSKGSLIDVLISKSIFYNPDGTVAGILSVLIDISERIKAENALRLSEQKLKEANAAKDKFFSIISHNLKNPFTALLGFSEMLIEDFHELTDEDKLSFLSEIKNSSRFAFTLLENLLQWSRIELGKLKCSPEYIQLKPLADEVMEEFRHKIEERKLVVDSSIPDSFILRTDFNMTKTILRNLFSNAVKFVNENGQINVTASKTDDNLVKIAVEDSGPGLKKKTLDNLFKIDAHQSSNGNSNEKGTGLGLIISKKYVDLHNGTIIIESEPGKGAKATVTLPAG